MDNPGESKWSKVARLVAWKMKYQHKWASVVYKTAADDYTRPMRITHVFAVTLGACVCCCMFLQQSIDTKAVLVIDPAQIIFVALISSIIIAPPTFVFAWAFAFASEQSRIQ